jgi:aminopeptidase N
MIFARIGYRYLSLNALYILVGVIIASIMFFSCQSSGSTMDDNLQDTSEYNDLTVVGNNSDASSVRTWIIPDGPEQLLRPLTWDLAHQKIWVRFNFREKQMLAHTELFFTSINNSNNELIIDAKEMQIHSVLDLRTNQVLDFDKDSLSIVLSLPETFSRGDSLFIRIEYSIHSVGCGLNYVTETNQVTSQLYTWSMPGQVSCWLPTIDHPAVRSTQETWISIPDEYQTLSNGALIYSRSYEGDSLRTDYWYMDMPHPTRNFALLAGRFDVTEEFQNGIVFRHYTEPEFTSYVYDIFSGSSDIMQFVTDKLDVKYPWGTFSQAPVKRITPDGIGSTTASFLHNGVQKTSEQLLDENNKHIIAQQIMRQWFGSYLASENWSDLVILESMASYLTSLYLQSFDLNQESDWIRVSDRQKYFDEAQRYRRPLIFNRYVEPAELFDSHTYNKGPLILGMLHQSVGDDIWWGALSRYVKENAGDAVNWRNFKTALEQDMGLLNHSIFDQWFLSPGHPEIQIRTQFSGNQAVIKLIQTQDLQIFPLYDLSLDIHHTNEIGEHLIRRVHFTTADTTYVFDNTSGKIGEIVVDPNRIVLAEYDEDLTTFDLISRLAHPSANLRYEAIRALSELAATKTEIILPIFIDAYRFESNPNLRELLLASMIPYPKYWESWIGDLNQEVEPYYQNRILAAWMSFERFGMDDNEYLIDLLDDPSSSVRKYVGKLLGY